ncbi:isoprenyl transferase [Varunaivibrio sulfuroxidans]|uniref:Isoprenyl transferase n=1 Tax=Varunaivibrio sulfuroxidans TaxID=1773489 RepID=A0A4R3JEE6_9PROT|nr:isoprenyl transferase [Varunaivibrio sulfuroxidans]TCS64157.1 undecaprenyl pyrophosphate synthetase [Varunaivibrio sulfuroxidans]WES31397.1 isoprenyl transferase [Varunaivibrio sulfuroxidans]
MKAVSLQTQTMDGQTPRHVAIIMDGNGRWAQARGLPRTAGHKRGAEAVRGVVEEAVHKGVRYLTLFGFSSENWKRPDGEVRDLLGIIRFYLRREISELHKKGIRLRVIGDRARLPEDIRALIDDSETLTSQNTRFDLIIALSYGGRDEIVRAARALAEDVRSGKIVPEDIDQDAFSRRLYTDDIPDPDLLIRTSGEKRVSNFLLWQMAYSELVFVDTLWPDFSAAVFSATLEEFDQRDRRYGAVRG